MNENASIPDIAFVGSLTEAVTWGIAIVIVVAGALSVFFIFYGGINFILSRGEEEGIKKALVTIRYSVVGLIVTILAVTLVGIVGVVFNIEILGNIRWERIIQTTRDMLDQLGTSSFEQSPSENTENIDRGQTDNLVPL